MSFDAYSVPLGDTQVDLDGGGLGMGSPNLFLTSTVITESF